MSLGSYRSFHYAIHSSISQQQALRDEDAQFLKPWAESAGRIGYRRFS